MKVTAPEGHLPGWATISGIYYVKGEQGLWGYIFKAQQPLLTNVPEGGQTEGSPCMFQHIPSLCSGKTADDLEASGSSPKAPQSLSRIGKFHIPVEFLRFIGDQVSLNPQLSFPEGGPQNAWDPGPFILV